MGLLVSALLFAACSGPASAPDPAPSANRVYHVQLQLTEHKNRAVDVLGQGLQWWKQYPASARPPLARSESSAKAIAIAWKAPFYRVRLGPFATEQQAKTVLDAFPDAFVAPHRTDSN
jgi:hypothetical protein